MRAEVSERRIRNNRIRRRRELRHHLMMGLLTIFLVISFSSLFFSFRTKAQGQDTLYYKYYKSVVVEEGDTLWHYAREYALDSYYDSPDAYIQEVVHINSLSGEQITYGQHLILPYYSAEFIN